MHVTDMRGPMAQGLAGGPSDGRPADDLTVSWDDLTGGVEFLFKKNKVDWLKGLATFKDAHTIDIAGKSVPVRMWSTFRAPLSTSLHLEATVSTTAWS